MRIGLGIDAHQLILGRDLIIGGVNIPHKKGLLGHSDADVLLHAVCDALLGAAALGDIGTHFPDDDAAFRDIDSMQLLKKVAAMLAPKYTVANIDATILAQKPKLAPYIEHMRENIAKALDIPKENVNIKASTTEHMGFEGREEGISAHCVCLLREE